VFCRSVLRDGGYFNYTWREGVGGTFGGGARRIDDLLVAGCRARECEGVLEGR